ncbi:hypothetical protein KBY93_08665 [Synechococcus sp. J7-Johnson]|uniref:hypothetical protein n=1 Tax=Synechococcus sp. J7-Johnson TaxID=2823737 RepID=UPI0020CCDB93|nr:hypothetical protein [Synechococcus sp. J7-Johnson]MCP9840707.1 hypothetical protein [Synechococcus sp. J7-Johnson]
MTLRAVRFLPEALEELLETQRWYGKRAPALARDFAETVAAAMERVRHNPQSFPFIHGRPLAELLLSAMAVCERSTVVALGEGTALLECLRWNPSLVLWWA